MPSVCKCIPTPNLNNCRTHYKFCQNQCSVDYTAINCPDDVMRHPVTWREWVMQIQWMDGYVYGKLNTYCDAIILWLESFWRPQIYRVVWLPI